MTIRTQALKVVTIIENSKAVLEGRIEALMDTPDEFHSSNTDAFKLIPFQNHAIGRDGLTKLIKRQNDFLYHTIAMSVVNRGK